MNGSTQRAISMLPWLVAAVLMVVGAAADAPSDSGEFVSAYFGAGDFVSAVFAAGEMVAGVFAAGLFAAGFSTAGVFAAGVYSIRSSPSVSLPPASLPPGSTRWEYSRRAATPSA